MLPSGSVIPSVVTTYIHIYKHPEDQSVKYITVGGKKVQVNTLWDSQVTENETWLENQTDTERNKNETLIQTGIKNLRLESLKCIRLEM